MTLGGGLLLLGSLSLVWGLAGWCYWKILSGLESSERKSTATKRYGGA